MTHKADCHYEKWNAIYQAWWSEHPNACKKCDASGYVSTYDTVDYGSTTATMESNEYCPLCAQEGKCPICGEALTWLDGDDRFRPCACGWAEDSGFRAPGAPECDCNDLPWDFGCNPLYDCVTEPLEEEEPELHNRETCQCGDCEEYRHCFCGGGNDAPCCCHSDDAMDSLSIAIEKIKKNPWGEINENPEDVERIANVLEKADMGRIEWERLHRNQWPEREEDIQLKIDGNTKRNPYDVTGEEDDLLFDWKPL